MAEPPFIGTIRSYFEAYARHDAEGCAGTCTPDAELHSPFGPPCVGRAAVAATHEDWFTEGEENKSWEITYARAEEKTGCCLLRFAADVPTGSGGRERLGGVSLCVLERQDDGSWKFRAMSLNTLPPDTDRSHDQDR